MNFSPAFPPSGIEEQPTKDSCHYLPLYKAVIQGDGFSAVKFFQKDPSAVTATISIADFFLKDSYAGHTTNGSTALHLAVFTGKHISFIEELVMFMPVETLDLKASNGRRALHLAAISGRTDIARCLVQRRPKLTEVTDCQGYTPLQKAAQFGHYETFLFLMETTEYRDPNIYEGELGAELLKQLVLAGSYDSAIDLVRRYPKLALVKLNCGQETALMILAQKPEAFERGNNRGFFQCLCSNLAVLKDETRGTVFTEIDSEYTRNILESLVMTTGNGLKKEDTSEDGDRAALNLVKILCEEAIRSSLSSAVDIIRPAILKAAQMGIYQFVSVVIKIFPNSLWIKDYDGRNIFHLAILHRREKVFNLLHQMSLDNHYLLQSVDSPGSNILHVAALLGPDNSNLGPALQMKRDMQWFKELERFAPPSYKTMRNRDGRTPEEVFAYEHKDLAAQADAWMSQVASSYSLVASLVAIVVFAAVLTIPGGKNMEGIPNSLSKPSFTIFAVSDGLALFASIVSLLMFLTVITSQDYLKGSSTSLSIGIATLLIAIASMLVAFSAGLQLVLVHRFQLIAVPIAIVAAVPAINLLLSLTPLFYTLIMSTFDPGIFRRQSEETIF